MTDGQKKKPSAGFWITVVLAVVVAYPLSFGPAVWLAARGAIPETAIKFAYWPLLCQRVHLKNSWGAFIRWYGSLGISSGQTVVFVVEDLEGDLLAPSFGDDIPPKEFP
jgi:hypothetical protein